MLIDTTFGQARTMLVRRAPSIDFFLVGAGGTGGWVAPQIFRLARALNDAGRNTQVIIIDHDRVEAKNVGRSNFAYAEIGRYKAQTLAERFGATWGVRAGFVIERFDASVIKEASGTSNSLNRI
ncbi:MAG: ThiF family adenylyltransferase [Pyrinomonadaceae bacterium MAG19_C2-C3]|nr:ThiF family adenylyltransferase [Pyrinomonadaceae bacterium MAG19_C2-C3]